MPSLLMARQPIFTRELEVCAYELLFREETPSVGAFDGDAATSAVLHDTFMDRDTEALLGPHKAYVNFTSEIGRAHV